MVPLVQRITKLQDVNLLAHPQKRKGDFVLQTGHVIEIVTKLYLVVQNATGRAPNVNVGTEFEANFGDEGVTFTFRAITNSASDGGQVSRGSRCRRIEI